MWVCRILHFLSNPAFSILTRCAGGDPQRNLSAAVGWGTRGSQPGGIGQIGLGMSTAHVPRSKQCVGLQDFAFPFKPCLFHPDPMRWWRFPTQLVRRCRVGHPPRGIGQMRPSCARTVAQGLGMGHMEKAFPAEPCLFHPDPMRWWRSPAQLVRRCRVGHPRVAAGGGSVKCVRAARARWRRVLAWDAWKKHLLSNPAFSILTRCAGGDPQRNLSAAVGWGARGSQPGGDRSNASELRAHGGAGSWHGTHGKSISCRTLPFPS